MPYSILVYLPSSSPRIDMPIGPDWFVATYWTAPAVMMGMPYLSSMTARAGTAAGFCLSGQALIDFANEVAQLKQRWSQSASGIFHGGFEMFAPNNFTGHLSLIEVIALEAFERAELLALRHFLLGAHQR